MGGRKRPLRAGRDRRRPQAVPVRRRRSLTGIDSRDKGVSFPPEERFSVKRKNGFLFPPKKYSEDIEKGKAMNPVLLEILPQIRAGMCCSQLLAALALQVRGEENTDWLRAARGLCHGVGQSGGPCGLLGGGAMILAYLSGQDNEPHPMLEAMCNDYAEWFYGASADFGGYGCEQISAGLMRQAGAVSDDGRPDMQVCGELLARCWGTILEILENYNVDIAG